MKKSHFYYKYYKLTQQTPREGINMQKGEIQIIRFPALRKKLGVSRSTIDRWEKQSKSFPQRIKLGENSVGWRLDLVEKWIYEKSITA